MPTDKNQENSEEEANWQAWYDQKTTLMTEWLGPEHDMVMHAIIPYALGGGLDLYYYPQGIPGTAIATKELCETPDQGSSNAVFDTYELVMFTRHPLNESNLQDHETPFGEAHGIMNAILNCIAPYSAQATLNPGETCEFPAEMELIGGKCLIFDAYKPEKDHAPFGLLAILEIHRSELDYARKHGGQALLNQLREKRIYPYTGIDRPPVV